MYIEIVISYYIQIYGRATTEVITQVHGFVLVIIYRDDILVRVALFL